MEEDGGDLNRVGDEIALNDESTAVAAFDDDDGDGDDGDDESDEDVEDEKSNDSEDGIAADGDLPLPSTAGTTRLFTAGTCVLVTFLALWDDEYDVEGDDEEKGVRLLPITFRELARGEPNVTVVERGGEIGRVRLPPL